MIHVWDLNFVLRSEIFVYWDEQLQASHLILGLEPVYSTWQAFGQALLVDPSFHILTFGTQISFLRG